MEKELLESTDGTHATITVELRDDGILVGTTQVGADGKWSIPVSGLRLGLHTFVAKSGTVSSAARVLTVQQATPPLNLDQSPVTLQTPLYMISIDNRPPTLPDYPAGSTVTRVASGGVPPYTYTSSNAAVLNVTQNGVASPQSSGSASVTVRDSAGQSKSYSVTVANIWTVDYVGWTSHAGALQYQKPGGHLPDRAELQAIGAQFRSHWPADFPQNWYWSSERGSNQRYYWCVAPIQGSENTFLENTSTNACSIIPRNA